MADGVDCAFAAPAARVTKRVAYGGVVGSRRDHDRKSQPVGLPYPGVSHARHRVDSYVPAHGRGFCRRRGAVSRIGVARRLVKRVARASRGLGSGRICAQPDLASRICRQPCLFTTDVFAFPATCVHHRPLGYELCLAFLYRQR